MAPEHYILHLNHHNDSIFTTFLHTMRTSPAPGVNVLPDKAGILQINVTQPRWVCLFVPGTFTNYIRLLVCKTNTTTMALPGKFPGSRKMNTTHLHVRIWWCKSHAENLWRDTSKSGSSTNARHKTRAQCGFLPKKERLLPGLTFSHHTTGQAIHGNSTNTSSNKTVWSHSKHSGVMRCFICW